jgi:hypothetical protein
VWLPITPYNCPVNVYIESQTGWTNTITFSLNSASYLGSEKKGLYPGYSDANTLVHPICSPGPTEQPTPPPTPPPTEPTHEGDFRIEAWDDCSKKITELQTFHYITGSLAIYNTKCTSIELPLLKEIGESINLIYNGELSTFKANQLQSIGKTLWVGNNKASLCSTGENICTRFNTCDFVQLGDSTGVTSAGRYWACD